MDRLNNVMEAVRHSHHIPAFLSLFVGLIVIKKRPSIFFNDDDVSGDNIPSTLMDGLNG